MSYTNPRRRATKLTKLSLSGSNQTRVSKRKFRKVQFGKVTEFSTNLCQQTPQLPSLESMWLGEFWIPYLGQAVGGDEMDFYSATLRMATAMSAETLDTFDVAYTQKPKLFDSALYFITKYTDTRYSFYLKKRTKEVF